MFPETRIAAGLALGCSLVVSLPAATPAPVVESGTDKFGREYYVYLPEPIDPQRTYWLVAGIHGAKGNGKSAGGMADWTNLGNCIVLGPSFPDGYQGLQHDTDKQLLDLVDQLSKKYRLEPRIFVAGFSGGSQFAHRFALRHPDRVIGCAAHSGGTWATAEMKSSTKAATAIPFVISCGQRDEARAFPTAPMTRIEWATQFADLLKQRHFVYQAKFWPDTGHKLTPAARELTWECFSLATTGLTLNERSLLDKLIAGSTPATLKTVPDEFARARRSITNDWNNLAQIKTELDKRARKFVAEACATTATPPQPGPASSSRPPPR